MLTVPSLQSYGSSEGICGVGATRGTSVLQDLWLAVGSGEVLNAVFFISFLFYT